MKRKAGVICIIAALVCSALLVPADNDIAADVINKADSAVVVIDPGHGGMDGGASSSAGISEKDINLNIARMLKSLLEKEGCRVIMTREDDSALCDEDSEGSIRSHKTEDMKERKRIIDEADADLAVSIHLNSFTQDTSVRGAQVFFPAADGGENYEKSSLAAEIIQKELNGSINLEKERTELGKNDVFILRDIRCPIVIVECGFLSNPQEAEELSKNSYQGKIASTLKAGICSFLEVNSM
ncbi:MAG: N-acetylmuramoyl-L-alanine amidase [Lentihominibacter sp.]